jgi:[ribosomal protein S5]-alanine N-acetyltransferase
MENMPYRDHVNAMHSVPPAVTPVRVPANIDWRHGLPTLTGAAVRLRELRRSDAASLLAAMSTDEVARFISPPPTTVEGFERFIAWTHQERSAGRYACFAITARANDTAIGLFQLRALDADFGTAEWGFALAVEHWGNGMFADGAQLMLNFTFNTVGVHRLEARAAVRNGRGNGALRKVGAVQEGVLRRSFVRNGKYFDQALWTILQEDWRQAKVVWGPRVIVH